MQHGRTGRRSPGFNMVSSFSRTIFVSSLLVIVLLTEFVHESTSEVVSNNVTPAPDPLRGPFDCGHLAMRAAKRLMKVLSRCGREVKANTTSTKEFSERMGCVLKCALTHINLTDSNSRLKPDALLILMRQFVESELLIQEFHTLMHTKCGKAEHKLDPTEEKCESYSTYVLCLQVSLEEFMNTSPFCIKKKKKTGNGEDEMPIGPPI